MSVLPVYLDSSAIVKLIVEEPETGALIGALARAAAAEGLNVLHPGANLEF